MARTDSGRDASGMQPQVVSGVARLVGRGREMETLRDALEGRRVLVLIEGEAGIGKTRLVRELLRGGTVEGGVVLAACPALRQPQTLGALVDAVRRATNRPAEIRLTALAGALRPLLPEWADLLPPAPEPAEDATAARHRLFRALAELLEGLEVGLLIVEDAHWADEATLEFLLFLRADPGSRFSIVVTSRPEEVPEDSLLGRLTAHRSSGGAIVRLRLGPLSIAETAELVSSMVADRPVSAEFAGFLHTRTEGVPLAVEELVRLLADRADVAWRDGELVRRDVDLTAVPDSIRDAVLERVRRLAPPAREVLRAIAVLDEPAAEAVIRHVAALEMPGFAAALAQVLDSGMVSERRPGQISFRHVLASQAVYESATAAARRVMHLRAGQLLERAGATPSARLLRHFREAGDSSKWAEHAELAAAVAFAAGDAAAADRVLQDLIINGELPGPVVARVTGKMSFAAFSGGADWNDLIQALRSAIGDDRLAPAERAMLRFHLARALAVADDNDTARAELELSVEHLPAGSMEAVWAMHKLAWPRGTTLPAREHLRWLRRAETIPVTGTPVEHLRLLMDRATALLELGEESGWTVAAQLPGHAASADENYLIALSAANVGDEAIRWGRYTDARHHLGNALRVTEENGYHRLHGNASVTLAHLDWHAGNWSGLAGMVQRIASDPSAQAGARAEAALILGHLFAAAGEAARARKHLTAALDQMRRQGTVQYVMEPAAALARLSLHDGDTRAALAITDEPVAVILAKGIWTWATEVAPVRMDALAAAGRTEEAAELAGAMGDGLLGKSAPAPAAALAMCEAILAAARGDYVGAAEGFARAEDAWLALPRPLDGLLARDRRARCLLVSGRRDQALAMLTEVARELGRLGAVGHCDRIVRSLRDYGVAARRPVSGRPSYGSALSPRELEAVRLVVAGKTDKQIASLLVVSPATVAAHLKSARRKLNVSSRTALAVAARDAGLMDSPG